MSQLNDVQKAALIDIGYSGSINEMMVDWAQANGATSDQYNTAIIEALQSNGATSYQPNTAWMEFLTGKGYSGTLPEMFKAFWEDGGVLETLTILDSFNSTVTAADETIVTSVNGRLSDSGHSWEKWIDISVIALTVFDATDEAGLLGSNGACVVEVPATRPIRLTADFRVALSAKGHWAGFALRADNTASPTAATGYVCSTSDTGGNVTAGIYLKNGSIIGQGTLVASTVLALTGDTKIYRECEVTDNGATITYTDPVQAGLSVSLATSTYNTQKLVGLIGSNGYYDNFKTYL